jgi:hypothetical protein
MPTAALTKSGGFFSRLCAFLCWYNAFAGLADPSNSGFVPLVVHFRWLEQGRKGRDRSRREDAGEA